jgi:hypothetical protein
MPERIDHVTVATGRERVRLPWKSRDALLAELRHLDSAAGIRKAFEDVGATRPVTLSDADRALLYTAVEHWSHRLGSFEDLPAGVWDLRCAIADDMHHDPPGRSAA